jgi:hypothetical protein
MTNTITHITGHLSLLSVIGFEATRAFQVPVLQTYNHLPTRRSLDLAPAQSPARE